MPPAAFKSIGRTKKCPEGPALQGGQSSHRLGQSLTVQYPSPLVGLYPPGTFSVPKRKADGKPVWHRGFINDALVCVQELASALTCS